MNRSVTSTLAGVDAIVLVVEAWEWDERDDPVLALIPPGVPVILALNKVDRVKDKAKLAKLLAACAAKRDFAALVPVSAEKGTQVKALADEVAKLLPEAEPIYGRRRDHGPLRALPRRGARARAALPPAGRRAARTRPPW